MLSEHKIKFVELENFYENLSNPLAAELFRAVLEMRKCGYGRFYKEKFLPFDNADLIATHYLICLIEGANLIPLAGFARVSLTRCDAYRVRFPVFNWVDAADTHLAAIEQIANEHRLNRRHLTYGFRAVLHQKAKKFITPEFFKEYTAGSFYKYFLEHGRHTTLAAAIRRARTLEWFKQMGFRKLCRQQNEILPAARHPKSKRDSFFIVEMEKPSEWTKQCYEKHKTLFAERVRIAA
jgi:hypothetical protein